MTFSLMAACPETNRVGTVVASSSICVASRCSFVVAGVGAAQSQNITDPALGPALLQLSSQGLSAQEALEKVVRETSNIEWRQIGLVDRDGQSACHSGDESLGLHSIASGRHCAAMGNMLENREVPSAMVSAFEQMTHLDFPERLLAALEAGLAAGGEAGPIHSAGLLVAGNESWPIVDLRVDWDDQPGFAISRLRQIWQKYAPQMEAYITRATNPATSESYGVPGDT